MTFDYESGVSFYAGILTLSYNKQTNSSVDQGGWLFRWLAISASIALRGTIPGWCVDGFGVKPL